jgi:type I restriction enzyme, S subunit
MTVETFLEQFAHLADAPNGIPKLRELILQLAVRGKLVEQDPNDDPASELLKKIQAERQRLIDEGEVPKPRASRSVVGASDESSFAVPGNWKWSTLGAITCYIQRGKGPKYVEQSSIPVISQKCIQWRGFTMEPARFIDPISLDKYGSDRLLRTGDLLWNSTGTGTIGRINVYEHDVHDYEKVMADSHVTVVRPVFMDSRFVWTFLASPDVQDGFEDRASGSTNQIELSTTAVRNQRIPIAPLEEQKRIVAKVDELMALCDVLETNQQTVRTKQIALNRASLHALTEPNATSLAPAWNRVCEHFDDLYTRPETVAELRQTILQLAVVGRLVPQDPNDEPASEVSMEELVGRKDLQNGLSLRETSSTTPYRCLRLSALRNGVVDCENAKPIPLTPDRASKYLVAQGNVFVVRGNGSKNLMGRAGIVECQPEGLIFPDLFIRIPLDGDRLLARYFLIAWNSPKTRRTIERLAKTTSGIWKVNQGHVASVVLRVPSRSEQERIIGKVDQLMTLCDSLEAKLQQTQTDADNLLTAIVHELVEVGQGAGSA